MPKVISPGMHALLDYAMVGATTAVAVSLWKKNKVASISAMLTAAAIGTNVMLTDMPGGIFKVISFPTHGRIDLGTVGMCASLPGLMRFSGEPGSRFFHMQAVAIGGVASMTDFTGTGENDQKEQIENSRA